MTRRIPSYSFESNLNPKIQTSTLRSISILSQVFLVRIVKKAARAFRKDATDCLQQGRTQGRGVAAPPNPPPQNRNLKNTDFADIMISKDLRDFPFSRNRPLKSADDYYIRILKNKVIKLKKEEAKTL
jgi:hypothetical protein